MEFNLLKTSLDGISVILFIILIIYLPDIDIQNALENIGINTTFKLTIILVLLLCLAMIIYCYSKITSCIIFVCISLFLRTQFKYIESYQNPNRLISVSDNNPLPNSIPNSIPNIILKKQTDLIVEEYLLKQISDDPNKTNLEKDLIKDITQKYFLNSDKLKKLTNFNEKSEDFNIESN